MPLTSNLLTGRFSPKAVLKVLPAFEPCPNTVHAGSWDTAVTVTTSEDIGILTAKLSLLNGSSTVSFTRLAYVTYAQLADIVESILSRKVQRVEWSVPRLKEELARP